MSNQFLIPIIAVGSFFSGLVLKQPLTSGGHAREQQVAPISNDGRPTNSAPQAEKKLGAFSVSLSVKDLKASKDFYEKLGFTVFGGSMDKNYLIMKSETTLIGIFQGMFDGTMLTFNPGWDANAKNIAVFDDIRDIQKRLKSSGIPFTSEVDEKTKGPGSFMLKDPDGNMVLFDQHR